MANPPILLMGRDRLTALGLAAVVVLAGGVRMVPRVCGAFHDDAVYVSTARALATGNGYRLTGVPGAPLQTKYPILYPATLATICYLWPNFPDNLLAMQIFTLLCGAGVVAFGYLYLVRFGYCERGAAAAGAVVCATNPFFLYFCVQSMAEMPYALLAVAALWALDGQLASPAASRRAQFGLGVLLALPFLCRTIGAVFIVAGIVVLWRTRRPVRWCLAGATATALPWVCWCLQGRGDWDRNPIEGYYTDYLGCWSSTGVQMVGRVFCQNAPSIVFGGGDLTCEGLFAAVESFLTPGLRELLLMAVSVIPWLMLIPPLRQGRPLPWALAVYLLVLLFWSWPPQRFLVPILPFLTVYLLMGLAQLPKRLPRGLGRWSVAAAGLGLLVVANLGLLTCYARITSRSGYPLMKLPNSWAPYESPISWAPYERTMAWLRQHSGRDDVVASGLDSMVSLYTDRTAFRPYVYNPGHLYYAEGRPHLMTVEELVAILKHFRPRYLVQMPMRGFAEEKLFVEVLDKLRRRHPSWLTVVYEDADSRFVIFELDPDKQPVG